MKKNFIAAGMLAVAACHSVSDKSPAAAVQQSDTLRVPDALKSKINIAAVESTSWSRQIAAAGVIKAIPTQYAEIAPPFPGRITKVMLQLGMKTSQGTPLFEITSPDFIAAQKAYFQEKTQLQQAERAWKRQQDLVAHGVGTQKDLEEAQTAYEVEKKEYENAVMGLRVFKADPEHIVLGQPLVVHAPIAGEITENKVVLGQFIRDDAASVATLANLAEVWIAAQVKEKDIRFLHTGDECTVDVVALPGTDIKGKVSHVNAMVDEDSRSIQVLITVPNTSHALKPGMYVTVRFSDQPAPAVQVPATALLQASENPCVFVALADGRLVKRRITTGPTNGQQVIVSGGLEQHEKIVTQGAFYLADLK